jgi:DNA-directed RNA polymerase subunit M
VFTHDQREQQTPVLTGGEDRGLPVTDTECPSCGHDEAYWDIQQLRAADEAPTILYICTECGQTTRKD